MWKHGWAPEKSIVDVTDIGNLSLEYLQLKWTSILWNINWDCVFWTGTVIDIVQEICQSVQYLFHFVNTGTGEQRKCQQISDYILNNKSIILLL